MTLFLRCRQAVPLLTDYEEGTLPWPMALRLRVHLAACAACRSMLTTLEALPAILDRSLAADQAPAAAREALAAALRHLGDKPLHSSGAGTPVPSGLQAVLDKTPDEPLRLLALAHAHLNSVLPRETDSVLPQEVATELPPKETWTWRRRGGLRVAELVRDAQRGSRLLLMYAPPGLRIPHHSHRGTESLLLLDGEMADVRGSYATGDWIYFEEGSLHAPVTGEEGCWCLVREEGSMHFEGPLGWLRNWLAA